MLSREEQRQLGDAYAIALLQWPAVIGFLAADGESWGLALKVICGAWAVLLSLTVTFGRRGKDTRFGLAITLSAGLVAAAWVAHPGPWMYLWLALLVISLYASQRARLRERPVQDAEDAG